MYYNQELGLCIEFGPVRVDSVRRGGGGERVTRAYTVEVQTASVFYAQSLILLLFRSIDPLLSLEAVKHGHTISAVGVEPCTGRLYFSAGTRFMSTSS